MDMFKITNLWKAPGWTGRFDGTDYFFPYREPVFCEADAAQHIFGIGKADKTEVLARHGWATYSQSIEEGMKILNAFKFERVVQKLDAPLAAVTTHGPAPVGQDAPFELEDTDGSNGEIGAVETPQATPEQAAAARAARKLPPARQAPAE